MQNLMKYYIVDRKSGVSYTPDMIVGGFILATCNMALGGFYKINIARVVKGIAERRYRLTPRTLTSF